MSFPLTCLRTLFVCIVAASTAAEAAAASMPPGFADTPIATGLSRPTAMAFASDGRLFVCEQGGTLRVIKNDALLPTPFVSLTVNAAGERGLLGVAFDPDFAANGYVYLYYTATTPTIHNRVSRFTAAGDTAVAGSETILLELETLGATNHNGGAIHFGKDGRFYVAVGENAAGANAQTLTNRLGKMLRINADGTIPSDNPFYATATGDNRAIWALGLRNPFTFAVHPLSGALFINDVGESSREEINLGVAGANYGWPATEAATANPNFQSPIYAYSHADGCAIAGGAFHNLLTRQFPFRYWGAYFFADLCDGWIRYRRPGGAVEDFASGILQPVGLEMSSAGALYYLARGAGSTTGVVSRISYPSQLPKIDITANGSDGPVVLSASDTLELDIAFTAGAGGTLDPAEVYIAVATPFGLFWLDPVRGFTRTPSRIYAGPLQSVELSPWLTLPNAGGLPPGAYWWIVLVDDDADGVPAGDLADFVVAVVN